LGKGNFGFVKNIIKTGLGQIFRVFIAAKFEEMSSSYLP
jgi:hypothetical protein